MWTIVFAALALAPAAGSDEPKRPPCCFTNPRYSGVCSVEPSPEESCGRILEYLNTPQSQGKSYCGNTNIRGGWASQQCAPVEAPEP